MKRILFSVDFNYMSATRMPSMPHYHNHNKSHRHHRQITLHRRETKKEKKKTKEKKRKKEQQRITKKKSSNIINGQTTFTV